MQFRPDGRGETGIPLAVIPPLYMAGGQTELLLGEGVGIVAATLDNPVHQFISVGRNIANGVSGIPQGVEDVDGRGRRVQADGVADAGVFGRVVAQYDGDALVGVSLAAQGRVAGRQAGQIVHPVGHCRITLRPSGRQAIARGRCFLFKRYRHGDDTPVKLRERYIHCGVNGPQAQRTVLPFCPAAGADNALYNRHIQFVQQFLRPTRGRRGSGAALLALQVAHRQPHRIDDAVHARDAVGIDHILGQGVSPAAVIVLRGMLQAVGKDGQDIDFVGFQAADEVINESKVAAHPVGAVEQDADAGPAGNEASGDVVVSRRPRGSLGMVNALPRHRRRGFVSIVAAEVSVGKEQEQVAEIDHAPAHQVGKDGFHLGDRGSAGRYQILVPFLVARAGN